MGTEKFLPLQTFARSKQSLKRRQKKIHKRSSDENYISENSNETQNDVNLNAIYKYTGCFFELFPPKKV